MLFLVLKRSVVEEWDLEKWVGYIVFSFLCYMYMLYGFLWFILKFFRERELVGYFVNMCVGLYMYVYINEGRFFYGKGLKWWY